MRLQLAKKALQFAEKWQHKRKAIQLADKGLQSADIQPLFAEKALQFADIQPQLAEKRPPHKRKAIQLADNPLKLAHNPQKNNS
ncbi:hypothetical protein [Neobacillus mesonae]|uniref:hypothetical protein n=1 Tax=Neobacillus mesonae TaxID=1193713 RepID=UPI00203EDE9F|nr:hypothetical protein [Neobacillus mesonae]MCM3566918.1 hypothetical protein [Neobacillus mesonae]